MAVGYDLSLGCVGLFRVRILVECMLGAITWDLPDGGLEIAHTSREAWFERNFKLFSRGNECCDKDKPLRSTSARSTRGTSVTSLVAIT
jgi:hypothetical protein